MFPAESFSPSRPTGHRAASFALVIAAHAVLLWGLAELAARPAVRQAAEALMVRLIEPARPTPAMRPPLPARAPNLPVPPPSMPTVPAVVVAAESPAAIAVAVAPPSPVISPPPAAPLPVEVAPPSMPVVAARFDADYLSNPKPVYPVGSRRLGEEGTVVLRVKVSPGGTPLSVEIKRTSGFTRLDDAARRAVEQWRFVPARRGDEPVEAWVSVPIVFSLQTS